MKDFVYTKERQAGPEMWCFSILASLNDERKAQAVAIAKQLYEKRFHIKPPTYQERQSGDAIVLEFPIITD